MDTYTDCKKLRPLNCTENVREIGEDEVITEFSKTMGELVGPFKINGEYSAW